MKLPVESLGAKLASLPEGVSVYAWRMRSWNDYERFEALVDREAGGGEVVTE